MENEQNEQYQNNEEIEQILKKRVESRKFIKIYMFTFLAVVLILITISSISQDRLNDKIEQLTNEIDYASQEALQHLSNIDEYKSYLESQTSVVNEQKILIEEQSRIIEENDVLIRENIESMKFLQEYIKLQKLYSDEKYSEFAKLAQEIFENEEFFKIHDETDTIDGFFDMVEDNKVELFFTQEQINQFKDKKQKG